jgi:hypothetical protein
MEQMTFWKLGLAVHVSRHSEAACHILGCDSVRSIFRRKVLHPFSDTSKLFVSIIKLAVKIRQSAMSSTKTILHPADAYIFLISTTPKPHWVRLTSCPVGVTGSSCRGTAA